MSRKAFTLIELLVVIAVISILAALLMPALRGALAAAQMAACMSNQRQMGLAIINYTEDNRGALPPAYVHPSHAAWGADWGYRGMQEFVAPYADLPDYTSGSLMRSAGVHQNSWGGSSGFTPGPYRTSRYRTNDGVNTRYMGNGTIFDCPATEPTATGKRGSYEYGVTGAAFQIIGTYPSDTIPKRRKLQDVPPWLVLVFEINSDISNGAAPVYFTSVTTPHEQGAGIFGQANYLFPDGHVKSSGVWRSPPGNSGNYLGYRPFGTKTGGSQSIEYQWGISEPPRRF